MSISRRRFAAAATASLLAVRHITASNSTPVERRVRPGEVKDIGGFIGRRLALNVPHLTKFDIDPFLTLLEQKKYTDWFWAGEQPGKWLEAAIYANATFKNQPLEQKARAALSRMIASQDPDGYLGITDPSVRTTRHPVRGMDPYEQYFTLHALLTASDEWQSQPANLAARRLGDFFTSHIKANVAEFWPVPKPVTIAGHEVHYGLEGTLLIDPMMRLYQTTGDVRYLDWCKWVVANIDKWSVTGTFSNLLKVADGTMPLNEIQPNVHAHTLHMNMMGFLRLYEVTGDASILKRVQGAWRAIMANYRYITGGVSVGESYRAPHVLPNEGQTVETCSSKSWLLLNQHLLELTGDAAFADAMELNIWNHLLAAQTWDGDGFRYFIPLNGWKPDGYFTGPDCCSSSGPRILSMLPGLVYSKSPDSVSVNQYVPSTLSLRLAGESASITTSGDYPEGSNVRVEISNLSRPATFTLRLRIPGWCANPSLRINGQSVTIKPGMFAAIKREWKRGDTAELSFPMESRWITGDYTNKGLVALTRGPLVYALDTVWTQPGGVQHGSQTVKSIRHGSTAPPIDEARAVNSISKNIHPARSPEGALGPVYQTKAVLGNGEHVTALMLPFANLGRWYGSEAERTQALAKNPGKVKDHELTDQRHAFAVWSEPS